MTARVQGGRTATPNAPPADGSLAPGELYVEMADPLRLWTGVPTGVAAAGKRLVVDPTALAAADAAAVKKAGDTMTGPLVLSGQPTLAAQAANMSYVDTQSVSTFNTRKGVVTLTAADITGAGGALLASPALSGNPTSTTPPPGDNDTSIATTAFVNTAIAAQPGTVIAPTVPAFKTGQLWWDSTGGQLYVGYDDGSTTQYVPASNTPLPANVALKTDVDAAQNNVGRNLIHNPLFNVAQRGVGPFNANGYTLDRWALFTTLDAAQVSRSAAAIGFLPGDETALYALLNVFTGNAGATSQTVLYQGIEGVHRLAGKTVIVSFYAAATAGTPKIGISLDQLFGSGGSPSASGTGQSVTISTTWARYSLPFTIPSIAGKTLGADHFTSFNVWYSSGATSATRAGNIGVQSGTVSICGVQLEIAQPGQTQPTPLEKPDPQQDLAKCQRFFQTGIYGCVQYAAAGGYAGQFVLLPVPMRGTPFVVVGATIGVDGNVAATNAPDMTDYKGFRYAFTATATGTVTATRAFTASADL